MLLLCISEEQSFGSVFIFSWTWPDFKFFPWSPGGQHCLDMHWNITRKLVYWDFCSSSASICEWKLEENSKQALVLLLDIDKIIGIDIWYIDEKRQKKLYDTSRRFASFWKTKSRDIKVPSAVSSRLINSCRCLLSVWS